MGASGLGALLVKEGFLTEQDRVTITKTCGQGSWAFAKCILATGLLDEDELSAFFAERTKYVVAPKNLLDRLDTGIVEQVDRRMVSRLEVLPLEIDHQRITVAVADPLDKSTLKQLEFFTGLEVVPVIAPLSQIHEGLSRLNPEFKPRPTALSNFLRNHAGTAWIKQKIVEEGDIEVPHEQQSVRNSALDSYGEEDVEDVALDDEIDAMDGSGDNLNDIDASSLDDGLGNSDFDDIDLEDSGNDLELAPGDDPDHGLDAAPIDDAGLDIDDPFDSFDDTPKKGKAAPQSDEIEGLEADGELGDDLWPDADDAPAKPSAAAKAGGKAQDRDEMELGDELADDFGLEDAPAKAAPPSAAADDDLWPSDEEEPQASSSLRDDDELGSDFPPDSAENAEELAAAIDDDLLGETPDLNFGEEDDEPKAAAADDELDDFKLEDDVKNQGDALDTASEKDSLDDLNFGNEDIDGLLDEPAPKNKAAAGQDLMGFAQQGKAPPESTRMASRPLSAVPTLKDEPEDLIGVQFADDEETSVSLRRAVHEEGSEPEFHDPGFDGEPEETRIDLHAAIDDDLEFGDDKVEDTNIPLHEPDEKAKTKTRPPLKADPEDVLGELDMDFAPDEVMDEPAAPPTRHKPETLKTKDEPLLEVPDEDLAMGFRDDDVIDEPGILDPSDEPGIDDITFDADKDDHAMEKTPAPLRAGGRSASADDNGSEASLTATAKANEALLRMSLCFDRDKAVEIAREYLPQISGTGCLVDVGQTTETLATWRSGAQSAPGKAAVYQRLAKVAKNNQWSEIAVTPQDDFGSVKAISVYKIQKNDGRVLLLAGDYPMDDESLREALTSFAEQMGAK
jgi:hypothetical protein